MAVHVLVVDDDPSECRHVEDIVRSLGHHTETVTSGEAALARFARADAPPIAAMIVDLVMPDLDGMAVLDRLTRRSSAPPVIVQAAPGGADAGVAAMRAGAFDFLLKPAAPDRLRASLTNALRIGALESEVLRMRLSRSGALGLSDIVMQSSSMERVQRLAERAARSRTPVLIEGEHGTGKALLARAIHGSSARRGRSFVRIDCSQADQSALEHILSASSEAGGGTLFLDEIGALPADMQRRLAELLNEQEAGAASSGRRHLSDIRLIAATSRRLIDLVSEGAFDEALFYHLNVLPIWLPPLRERRSDIPDLARSFLARLAPEAGRSFVTGLSPTAMALLAADAWPGNIRELEHAVFRAIMLCQGAEITVREFPLIAARNPGADDLSTATDQAEAPSAPAGVAVQGQFPGEYPTAAAPLADSPAAARYGLTQLLDDCGEMRSIQKLEEEVIRFAIDHYSGRMSEVARRLGIGRSTLYRKVRDYGIAVGEPAAS